MRARVRSTVVLAVLAAVGFGAIAYARAQRAGHVLVVGSPRTGAEDLLDLDLGGDGERTLAIAAVLESPDRYFSEVRGSHA